MRIGFLGFPIEPKCQNGPKPTQPWTKPIKVIKIPMPAAIPFFRESEIIFIMIQNKKRALAEEDKL